jgi:predicted RNase H-like nuclease (RuvC/YqgF family)
MTTFPTPSPGELAEQRHLVDPLDHALEHLADEQHPAKTPLLSPKREAEIVARLDDEDRTASELTDIVTELLTELRCVRAEADQLYSNLTGANLARWEEEQDNARLRLALASAQRGRRELRAQGAEVDRLRAELAARPSRDDAATGVTPR